MTSKQPPEQPPEQGRQPPPGASEGPVRALDAPAGEDLSGLSRWLSRAGIVHRFHEEVGQQVLLVANQQDAEQAREALAALRRGDLEVPVRRAMPRLSSVAVRQLFARVPVTLGLILLTLLAWPATWGLDGGGGGNWLLTKLTFVPVELIGEHVRFGALDDTLASGEWWRLWTPTVLHFGAMHLVFNLVFLWQFGLRVEVVQGGRRLLMLVVILGVAANLGQYLMDTGPLFGGLSGVLYGLLGYLLWAGRMHPDPRLQVPGGLALVMLGFLVLFSTNITNMFGLYIGNGSHWAGLAAGILAGVVLVRRETTE